MEKNRWYDEYPELSKYIERIKEIGNDKKNKLLSDIKDIVINDDPEIIDKHVLEFPMTSKRRWYDKDPYSWLVINALKYADISLINKVTKYLKYNL